MPDRVQERVLGLSGAPNFRDFGGYRTGDGRRVKWRHLFRSDRLSILSPQDCAVLDTLHVHTVFDLRARREREADPTCWTRADLNVQTYPPGLKIPLVEMAEGYAPDEQGALALMIDFYQAMPRTMAHIFGDVIRALAQGASPCIIHCSAGKDRTGVACALILDALGVPREVVVEDYALTQSLRRRESEVALAIASPQQKKTLRNHFPPGAERLLMASSPDYIAAAFSAIEEDHGSVGAYLSEALEIDDRTLGMLRERLLQPAG